MNSCKPAPEYGNQHQYSMIDLLESEPHLTPQQEKEFLEFLADPTSTLDHSINFHDPPFRHRLSVVLHLVLINCLPIWFIQFSWELKVC